MNEKPRRCFVIGPIGDEGSPERNHADMFINNIVRHALEDFDPPYEIARSDEREDPGMITDQMIHDILNAHLVIADLTFLNPNAFYELGIRHAAEKPVIHFAQYGTKLPFDASPHRAIIEDITIWPGTVSARKRIKGAVKATEVEGYRVSNPITQANASFKMRESADPIEQVVAELHKRVEQLEADDRAVWPDPDRGPRFALDLDELLPQLPRSATDVDRVLLAGYVAQSRSPDRAFSNSEANNLLAKLGTRISNPAQALKQNLVARRVFRHHQRYRVSQMGIDHLLTMVPVPY